MSQNNIVIPKITIEQLIGDQKVIREIICDQCKSMLLNPLMCNKCMNIWCEKCCNDRQYLPQSKCPNQCESVEFLKSPPLLDELFKIIKIKCHFHINQQEPQFICQQVFDYNEYFNHYQMCEYGYIQCSIQGCQKIIKRRDIEEHKKVCPTKEILLQMVKESHIKTIQATSTLNQITFLTERLKKDNDKLQADITKKSEKLLQLQKCMHAIQQQDNQ